MNKLPLAAFLVLCGAGCAVDPDGASPDALPSLATRALEQSPGANYVATFVPAQLRAQPDARARLAESIGWRSWASLAARLNLDPFEDASMVALTSFIGSCGPTDGGVVVDPDGDPLMFAGRVIGAVDDWRRQSPTLADDEARRPAPPELERWVTVADGRCTVLEVDYQSIAVTLRRDGRLELRAGFSGNTCVPASEDELPREALEATWLTSRALATGWGSGATAPAMVEAMPDGSEVTWIGARVSTARFEVPSPRRRSP
jgi:hypothetical protein